MKEFKLDKIKVDGTPASAASIASPGSSETVLMLPFEGSNNDTSTTDGSSTEHSITFNGDAKIVTAQKKYGSSSLYLDGSDHLTLADHADWTFGTGDFTWEFWVRFSTVTSSGYYILAANADSAGFFLFRWDGGGGGSGNWSYGYTSGGNNWADTLSVDTWYNVAVVRSSGDIKVYRDGVQKGSAWTHTTSLDANGGIHIGKSHSTEYMTGYLDDFRLTKGVARYTSAFTPPTSSHYTAAVEGSATKHIVVDSDGTGAEEGDLKEKNNRIAKAWVNFDGTGTVAIRSSYNVSSITDDGTGRYDVNFSTAMTDNDYSVVSDGRHGTSDSDTTNFVAIRGEVLATSKFGIRGSNGNGSGARDHEMVSAIVFGN
jgi:hypothetical protein